VGRGGGVEDQILPGLRKGGQRDNEDAVCLGIVGINATVVGERDEGV